MKLQKSVKKVYSREKKYIKSRTKRKRNNSFPINIIFIKAIAITNKNPSLINSPIQVVLLVNTRNEPHIMLDISRYDISLKERGFAKIQKYFQSWL